MPGEILGHFFGAICSGEIEVSDPSLINAFYARDIGGPNGITPFGSRVLFVMDSPSVLNERVTSHEIGHILALHHVLNDADHLMFSGTNRFYQRRRLLWRVTRLKDYWMGIGR